MDGMSRLSERFFYEGKELAHKLIPMKRIGPLTCYLIGKRRMKLKERVEIRLPLTLT